MSRVLVVAMQCALLLAFVAAPVAAHPQDEAVDPDNTTPIEYTRGAVELVAHHYFPEASDMMFQRREGPQWLKGTMIHDVRDFAFVGGDAKNSTSFGAMHVFDVTDPTAPEHLAEIPCSGYHAEVGVYENLMFQGIDSAGTNKGCADPATWDPHGLDMPGKAGIRVFDVTDPADPVVVGFIWDFNVQAVHNFTVNPRDGLLYLSYSGCCELGIVDLESRDSQGNRSFATTNIPLTDMGVNSRQAVGDCHDIGLNLERNLMACAASISGQTYVLDITDPRHPQLVSTIVAPEIVHHGARWAPDGVTLVLNDEFAGALDVGVDDENDIGVGSNGCLGPNGAIGSLWLFDTSDPTAPMFKGNFSPVRPEPTASPCTSHFYNFVPETSKVVVGWYEGGIVVADLALAPANVEEAVFLPEYGNFWAAYAYRGYLYGASRTVAPGDEEYTDLRGNAAKGPGGGLWVVALEGMESAAPAPEDEGTSWARWTSQLPEFVEVPNARSASSVATGDGWAWHYARA